MTTITATDTGKDDPYAGHRDEKGRFKKGKSGGPGRPIIWLSEEEARRRWRTLVERPPRCVCGARSYRFRLKDGLLYAQCNNYPTCREVYVYDAYTDRWVPFKYSLRGR